MTVVAPVKRAETLRRQIRSLEREQRLRSRAAMLVGEVGLFDDFAARSRQAVAAEKKTDTEGLYARQEVSISVAHEIAGIGDEGRGAPGLERELEELKAEIQKLRSIENCRLRN